MSVDLKLKRQIEIKDNDVKSIYDFEDAVSSDEFLKPFLQKVQIIDEKVLSPLFKPSRIVSFAKWEDILDIIGDTKILYLNKCYRTSMEIMDEANKVLEKLNLTVLDENNVSFDTNSKLLLTVQTAKGLEFDSVIIYNRQAFSDDMLDLRLLYVAETRTLHKLIICNDSFAK